MSHILMRAGARLQTCDGPIDLSNKYMKHTCDSLIHQEDLRQDVDAATRFAPRIESGFVSSDTGADVSTTSDSGTENSGLSDDCISVKQEPVSAHRKNPHPFSIDALLGDADDISTAYTQSAPAVISSAFSSQTYQASLISYQSYLIRACYSAYQNTKTISGDVTEFLQKAFWCHVCNALCIDEEDAKKHKHFHSLQSATCKLRKSLFNLHGYVSRHVKLDEEKIQCGLCDKVVAHCFFTKHQRLHDGHFCDVCNKEFYSNSRLQDHMNVHTGNTPFKCTICDRKFAKRSSLTQHHRYHRDHKSFKCSFCYKCFNSKYARAVHERLHTGDNPFKCPIPGCTRAFPQKIQLKLHMSSHSF